MINYFNFRNNSRENVFSNKIYEASSLELDGMNDSLVICVENNKFNSINNESVA